MQLATITAPQPEYDNDEKGEVRDSERYLPVLSCRVDAQLGTVKRYLRRHCMLAASLYGNIPALCEFRQRCLPNASGVDIS